MQKENFQEYYNVSENKKIIKERAKKERLKGEVYYDSKNGIKKFEKVNWGKLDYDSVVEVFEDFEEYGVDEIYVGESNNAGCDYIAYINAEDSTQFLFKLDGKI